MKSTAAQPLAATVLNPIDPATLPGTILHPASGTVLTVGAGMEFATLEDALTASVDGDTIAVKAGTYTNDFCTINTKVHILAMGGVVNEVATVPPPNDKGLFLVNNDLTLQGFTFTGGSDGSPDGNVAGIRYQGGNLNISYCCFHDMQEGLLAAAAVQGTGNITIDHSEFYNNGTGDGYTHDIYVGDLASFTLTNSYIHNANVGHEVKSRAAVTTIRNNIIADGPTGTASYDIDIPNAGVAVIANNVIEKGPQASNWYSIHYGGETQFSWANNSLSITGNTILNDLPVNGTAVLNQSQANGLNVSAAIDGNSFYGFSPDHLLVGGPGTITNSTTLTTEPGYSTQSPWTAPPVVQLAPGPELLNLTTFGHTVTGGASLLTVNDTIGNNTITGGTGGLHATVTCWDLVTTQPGRQDTVVMTDRNSTVHSAGLDTITVTGTYDEVDATGRATITGSSFSTYNLSGLETATISGGGNLNLASTARVTATLTSDVLGTKAAFAALTLTNPGVQGGVTGTIAGGSATFSSGGSTRFSLTYGDTGGAATLGGGSFTVTGGAGNDRFVTGSGTAQIALGSGMDSVTFGTGSASVTGGAGADVYTFDAAHAGAATITGFKQGQDSLAYTGFSGNPIASGIISGGSTLLTLSDGATVDLVGVVLPGYGSGTPPGGGGGTGGGSGGGGSGGGGGGGAGGEPGGGSGSGTLTTGGNLVTGGASLLTVTDVAGGNTVAGGAGGMLASVTGDLVTTQAGSQNQVTLGSHCTLTGAGQDQVTVTGTYNTVQENGTASVALSVWGTAVQGGAGHLTVTDSFGGNAITGGAGGVTALISGNYGVVTTQAGASDSVTAGGYSTLSLAGSDTVTLSGLYSNVTATGAASITSSSGWSGFDLEGQDTLAGTGSGTVIVGQHAAVTVMSTGVGGDYVNKLAGGTVSLQQNLSAGGSASVTVSGGQAGLGCGTGGVSVTTAGGDCVMAGSGSVAIASSGADTVWAGAANLSLTATGALQLIAGSGQSTVSSGAAGIDVTGGSGNITLYGGTGADHVTFGSGQAEIHAGASDVFTAVAGTGGSDTIYGWGGSDQLVFSGFSGNAIASQAPIGGSTMLTLTDGTHIELVNVAHYG